MASTAKTELAERPAASTTVDEDMQPLSTLDVTNLSLALLWARIYSYLPWTEVMRGRAVCTTFRRELPRLVKEMHVRTFSSAAARREQIGSFARTFTQLRTLTLRLPLSVSPESDATLWDDPDLSFPNLQQLHIEVEDGAEDVVFKLGPRQLPVLQELNLELHSEGAGQRTVSKFDLQLPLLQRLRLAGAAFHLDSAEPKSEWKDSALQLTSSIRASPGLTHLTLDRCQVLRLGFLTVMLDLPAPSLRELVMSGCQLQTNLVVKAPKLQYLAWLDPPPLPPSQFNPCTLLLDSRPEADAREAPNPCATQTRDNRQNPGQGLAPTGNEAQGTGRVRVVAHVVTGRAQLPRWTLSHFEELPNVDLEVQRYDMEAVVDELGEDGVLWW